MLDVCEFRFAYATYKLIVLRFLVACWSGFWFFDQIYEITFSFKLLKVALVNCFSISLSLAMPLNQKGFI